MTDNDDEPTLVEVMTPAQVAQFYAVLWGVREAYEPNDDEPKGDDDGE